jgi:hypothetical protein
MFRSEVRSVVCVENIWNSADLPSGDHLLGRPAKWGFRNHGSESEHYNSGLGLAWDVTNLPSWLTVSQTSGSSSARLILNVAPGTALGTVASIKIKFPLGHSSIQTTERYLGSEQDIEIAADDNLGL